MVWEFFQATQTLDPCPSMHLSDNSIHSQLEKLETLLQQSYYSVSFENEPWRQLHAINRDCHCKSGPYCVMCGVWMLIVFTSLISKVCLEWELKKTGVWSILIIYFFHYLSHFFPSLHEIECIHASPAGECRIHEYPSGTSTPVPSTTCTQSKTLHHLIWHQKCSTNLMPFMTRYASSLSFPAHTAQTHI